MSWATSYKTNNVYTSFPPILSDGRLYTEYSPSSVYNDKIRKENKIKSNSKYNEFLKNNANKIMNQNFSNLIHENNTDIFNQKNVTNNGHPYLFNHSLERSMPVGYEDSDLKNMYLSRQKLDILKNKTIYNSNV